MKLKSCTAIALLTLLLTNCSNPASTPTPETQTPPATQSQTTPAVSTKSGKIELKLEGGKAAFSLKPESDGAKLVDENDSTLKFWQEIYDNLGKLVEIHEKYPLDKGNVKLSDNDN